MEKQPKQDDNHEKPQLTQELIWVRSMLRVFSKLELKIRFELGDNGVSKIALKENYYLILIGFSLTIMGLGMLLFSKNGNLIYLSTAIFPLFVFLYLKKQIKEYKSRNIFRLLGKVNSPPDKALIAIEEFIFREKDYFEEIVSWHINKFNNFPAAKFEKLFDGSSWTQYDTAQKQCIVLAILMVSLQKYLHKNKKYYLEYVKKLPVMNEIEQDGYRQVQSKKTKTELEANDLQTFTFGGGFGFTKE